MKMWRGGSEGGIRKKGQREKGEKGEKWVLERFKKVTYLNNMGETSNGE